MDSDKLDIPGLELLFSSISSNLANKLDTLVALIHWLVIKEHAKCFQGLDGTRESELLPAGWNSDSNDYTLRYVCGGKKYVLKVIRIDRAALVHLMEDGTDRLATLNVNIDDVISSEYMNYDKAFVNLDVFYGKVKSELTPVLKATSTSASSSTSEQSTSDPLTSDPLRCDPLRSDPLRADPLRSDPLRADPLRADPRPYRGGYNPADPFNIGVGDLDPLRAGRPGGGMIFDPFRGGGGLYRGGPGRPGGGLIPPGSIPPGARFDPIGPDIENRRGPFRSGPGPDHMRPPDFDDSFM